MGFHSGFHYNSEGSSSTATQCPEQIGVGDTVGDTQLTVWCYNFEFKELEIEISTF
jgi:hypothetical protein